MTLQLCPTIGRISSDHPSFVADMSRRSSSNIFQPVCLCHLNYHDRFHRPATRLSSASDGRCPASYSCPTHAHPIDARRQRAARWTSPICLSLPCERRRHRFIPRRPPSMNSSRLFCLLTFSGSDVLRKTSCTSKTSVPSVRRPLFQ